MPIDRNSLRADCEGCIALCCVAPSFTASADFAIDKPAGVPCPNLRPDDRCSIHASLCASGFPGCAAYDCFGAGQRVVASLAERVRTPEVFEAFAAMRRRHELLWYLAEAAGLAGAEGLRGEVEAAAGALENGTIAAEDVDSLLDQAADLARGGPPTVSRTGPDLIGRDLRHADLGGADLRGAYLIRADLRRADLALADLRGADLRAADLCGARLGDALFLTRSQLGQRSATRRRPCHRGWSARRTGCAAMGDDIGWPACVGAVGRRIRGGDAPPLCPRA
jgi:uncharacterized protein YjbI with pentapeptide repeats